MKIIKLSRYSAFSITLLILLNLLFFSAFSQNFGWAKSVGGSINDDYGHSTAIDDSGNVYTTGYFYGTADFDPDTGIFNLTSAGTRDIFILKLDASGGFIWAKSMGGTNKDESYSIAIDDSGNVYTTGYFYGTADFDPDTGIFNLTSAGRADIFVSKLDASGNFIWAKKMGGLSNDYGNSIAVDVSGNIYTTGYFQDTVDINLGVGTNRLISEGGFDIFVSKLDASGNFIWVKSMGGANNDVGRSLVVDNSGSILITGFFAGVVDFDPGVGNFNLNSEGYADIFVSKLDASGNLIWAKSMGGNYSEFGTSIAVDDMGNVYTSGFFTGTVDFDPGIGTYNLTYAGARDIFILKLDSSGDFTWAKRMGGNGFNESNSIVVDDSGNIYTSGIFTGIADFDPGNGTYNLITAGMRDIFISKLDSSGSFLWAKSMGGANNDIALSMDINDLNNIYITGHFEISADFDPGHGIFNLTAAGGGDIFISKLVCQSSVTDTIIACNDYTWIDSITYTSSTSNPTYTLTNFFGCDSVVTLYLTINSNDTTVTVSNDTIMANQQGAVYQWLNCDSSFSRISGATNQIYTPSINGFFACEVSLNGCMDTTACVQVLVTGVDKTDISKSFKLYPNPFTSQLIIEAKGIQLTTSIEVLNVKGQLVYEGVNEKDGNKILNTSDWSKGIYFIRLINEEGVGTFKLVHQ